MTKKLIYFFAVYFLLSACREVGWEEHYQRPEWLKGNAWELLENRGEFSLFLEAVERAGFRSLVEGKGIVTVLAPTDQAINDYLEENGHSSLNDMSPSEIKKLIGYHLVYYSFDRQRFANYRPEGKEVERPAMAGLYYKHRTKSRDTVSVEFDEVEGKERTIFHKERFLPVFSGYMFTSKGIEPANNYEYFYPQSTWTGSGGFNISNASVEEYALPTDNGYVYIVDRVVKPLETVYNDLKSQSDYSEFIKIYDRFTNYWYDDETSTEYASAGDSLFIKRHTGLPQIASEWSYNGEGGLPDYSNLAALSADAYNVFAPNNAALQSFFEEYWAPYYGSIDEVDFLPLQVLLYNHVYSGSMVFPEEVERGDITSFFGNTIQFDPASDVEDKGISVNGVYYGLNDVIVPSLFNGVTGPMLTNPEYKMFLYMVAQSGVMQAMTGDVLDFTVFMPSDEVIQSTIYGGSDIFWNEGNPLKYGDESVEVENADGIRVPMSRGAMNAFVENHIVTEEIASIEGKKVFRTRNPFSYIYVTDEGVASSNIYNLSEFTNAEEVVGDWHNGKVYSVERSLIEEEGSFKYMINAATSGTSTIQEFSEFSKLLSQADLLESNQELAFLFGDNYMLFAPTNEAILEAKDQGLIPEDRDELEEYLKYYFVPIGINSINDYAFPGMSVSGDFSTSQEDGDARAQLTLVDNGTDLQVVSSAGETANVVSTFPKIFVDGAVYQIDNVLQSGQ